MASVDPSKIKWGGGVVWWWCSRDPTTSLVRTRFGNLSKSLEVSIGIRNYNALESLSNQLEFGLV